MAYDSNNNNRDSYQTRNNAVRNESEDQRTRRQNRIGLVILGLAVLAFIGGFAATMDRREAGTTETPVTTAANTTGSSEAAIAPAAGNATSTNATTTAASSGDMTGTGVNSQPGAQPTDMAATTTAPSTASGAGTAATTATATPASTTTTTASPATATEPETQNPKVYTSEESCRGSVNGPCQPISGGWTPVNPAPEKTAVPEAVAPSMNTTTTTPSTSTDEGSED